MKNFEIEHLERKNPYPLPENFFEQMQANVLKETVEKKQMTPIFRMNFSWLVAAAVALLAGLGIVFVNTDYPGAENSTQKQTPAVVANTVQETEKMPEKSDAAVYEALKKDVAEAEKTSTKNWAANEKKQSVKTETIKPAQKDETVAEPVQKQGLSEAEMENVLASFTPEEIKQASNNSEKDIYLDLYN